MMSNARFDEAMTDVAKIYAHPDDVVADGGLSHEQKVKLLRQWEFDLRENMVASEENMTSAPPQEGKSAELLRDVRKALLAIGGAGDENERAAPMKQGGA